MDPLCMFNENIQSWSCLMFNLCMFNKIFRVGHVDPLCMFNKKFQSWLCGPAMHV